MSNKPTLGFNIACAQNQFKRCQFNWGRKKNCNKGTVCSNMACKGGIPIQRAGPSRFGRHYVIQDSYNVVDKALSSTSMPVMGYTLLEAICVAIGAETT